MNKLKNYLNWKASSLYQVYVKPSYNKIRAYDRIISIMLSDEGYNLKLGCANTWSFSAGYLFKKDGSEYLKYFTSKNVYVIKVR